MNAIIAVGLLVGQAAVPLSAPPDTAVVRVGSRVVAVLRSPLGAAPVEERATAAESRIRAALARGEDSVSSVGRADGFLILISGRPVFALTPGDADTLAGGALAPLAAQAVSQLQLAAGEAREARDVQAILIRLLLALVATLTIAGTLRLLGVGRRWLRAWLDRSTGRRGIAFRGYTLVQPRQLAELLRASVTAAAWGAALVVAYVYLTFVLSLFPWTRAWGEALGGFLFRTVQRLTLGALHAVPDLFTVVLIFVAARFAAGLLHRLFDAVARGRFVLPGVHPDTALPTRRIVVALLWLFALIVAYPYLPGSGSEAFKGVSVFAGLLLTLGSAGLAGQAMSGMVLMYSRGFRPGDYVDAGGVQGTVLELGMLSTRLLTPKNETVTLPNNVVVASPVTNYSAAAGGNGPLFLYSSVTIGYDVDWRTVHELLIQAAGKVDGVLKEPTPFVLQRALNDFSVEYQVNAAIEVAKAGAQPRLYSELHANIQDGFAAAGVEIMSPTYHAVRDGNAGTLPAPHRRAGRPGAFRVDVNPAG